jgi:DNA-binding GntR family transcriptional regulator
MEPRQPLAGQVRAHLIAQVISGRLAPGARVRELEVAQELGVSQGPVREALREIAGLGLTVYEPNKGSRVRELSERDLVAAYPVRAALEELAGRLAAPHLAGATDRLEVSLAGMRRAATAGNVSVLAGHSIDFHREIVQAAASRPLTDAWQALGIELLTPVSLMRADVNLLVVAEEHGPILESLHGGDGDRAARLLAEHAGDYGIRVDRWARRRDETTQGDPDAKTADRR